MKSLYLIAQILFINFGFIFAQTVDDSFHKPVPYRPAKVNVIKTQADGKILLGGDITFYKEKQVNNLIRLNSDGSLDEGFDFKGKSNLLIERIEFLSTGDMIVLAQDYTSLIDFKSYVYSMFLLDSAGTIKKELTSLPCILSIAVQDDDKVLVCGIKNPYGFVNRYNPDLTPDDSFDNAITFDADVYDVEVKNGKIFAAGYFAKVNGTDANKIVRLNPDGSLDSTFITPAGYTDIIKSLTILDDGRILIGSSWSFDGFTRGGLTRLNPDGSIDFGFQSPEMAGPYSKIVVRDSSLYFASYKRLNGIDGAYVFKVNINGEMDPAFNPIRIDDLGYYDFHMDFLQDNILYNNSSFNGSIYGLSQGDSIGNRIDSFKPEISRYGTVRLGDYLNGKLVISGDFIRLDTLETYGIAMINEDGSTDQSFSLGKNLGKPIQIEVLNDTCLLFSTGKALVKLDRTGQIRPDFHFSLFKTLFEVPKFTVLENGKIFTSSGVNIYRLNEDGTEDTDFAIGAGLGGYSSTAFDFDVQGDKVVYGSMFDHYNDVPVKKMVRLNSDGSVDTTFHIGSGPDGQVTMIKILASGEMIIGGKFNSFNGIAVPHGLVKLGVNGSVDNSFNQNQKLSALNGFYWQNTKVEQIDSTLYIRCMNIFGLNQVIAMNINGKVDSEFAMPMIVDKINDIIVPDEDSPTLKKTKSTFSGDQYSYMYTLGNFKYSGTSFIMKLAFEKKEEIVSGDEDKDAGTDNIVLYPMPVNDKLCISFREPGIRANLELYTLNGQQLYSAYIHSSYGEVDMHSIPAGVYMVKVKTAGGEAFTYKIVKK